MNRSDRLSRVIDLVYARGRVEVDDLVTELGASPATVRRDLDALAQRRLIVRTRGGAESTSVSYDLPVRYREVTNVDAKRRIAEAVAQRVRPGHVVGLSGGTTATEIAEALASLAELKSSDDGRPITIVTNAINIALQLAIHPHVKTVVIGGVLNAHSYEAAGPFAELVLSQIRLDLAVIGAHGLVPDDGAGANSEHEAHINRLMAERSAQSLLAVDSAKIGVHSFAKIGGSDLFGEVITDSAITDTQRAELAEAGYRVTAAD